MGTMNYVQNSPSWKTRVFYAQVFFIFLGGWAHKPQAARGGWAHKSQAFLGGWAHSSQALVIIYDHFFLLLWDFII